MSNINYYLVRPYPSAINRIAEFKKQGIIAIGWSDLGDVSGDQKPELRAKLEEYYKADQKKLRSTLGTFMIFCLDLKKGDYILAPENKMGSIHIAQVTGDYYYNSEAYKSDYAHQRKVKWIDRTFSRREIDELNNTRFAGALKFPGTAANLNEYRTEISALIGIKPEENNAAATAVNTSQLMKTSYPLRPDIYCDISFPTDMTVAEAQRLATFVSTLSFEIPGKND